MSNPNPSKEIFVKMLALVCRRIRTLPSFRDHPSQNFQLLVTCDESGHTPLHYAAASGDIELVTLLANMFGWLRFTSPLDARDSHGQTALHWATMRGNGAVIQTLVESGASLNLGDEQGRTPLHIAVSALEIFTSIEEQRFCRGLIRYLLEHGANPNVADECGTCPIHVAAEIGDEDVIGLLVSWGASVHVRDNEGENVLFYAIRGAHADTVTKFVGVHKVDIFSRNEDGENALDYAKSLGDTVIRRVVESLVGNPPRNSLSIPHPRHIEFRENNFQENGSEEFSPNLSLSAGSRFSWDSLVVPLL